MPLSFTDLSDVLLEEIFQFINPEQLFELRLLNEVIYNIVNKVIKINLIYSNYNHSKHRRYKSYQLKFIKENGSLMKHLNITSNEMEYIGYCSNIVSLYYENLFNSSDNNNELGVSLPKLKRLVIKSLDSGLTHYLELFSRYLTQIEMIEVYTYNLNMGTVINYLNPGILKSLKLHVTGGDLELHGLDRIKSEFVNLKVLYLKSKDHISVPINFSFNLSFIAHVKLELEGPLDFDFIVNYFGDLKVFESIKLIDNSSPGLIGNDVTIDLTLFEGVKLNTLGYISMKNNTGFELLKLPSLKQVYIKNLSKDLLRSIASLPNVNTIYIDRLYFDIKEMAYETNINETCNYKCTHIKNITINYFYPLVEEFFDFLSFFPNLQLIRINKFNLMDVNTESIFELKTPLLLVAPITHFLDSKLCDRLKQVPMLSWIKLE
ncbi:hypothetical protein K502DRAFT_362294 [Neoconidiobolus thromboides FSU 785]|nr:hypothetical protein K502DRAFT_362294 [Neoconidiobolus thromboides FSU 785]